MIAALLPNTLVRRPTITPRTPQLRAKLADFDPPPPADDDYVDKFCRATNAAMEATVFPTFIRDAVAIRPSRPQGGFLETIKSPPELPGLARPVWLTIAASVPTALGWYGYYKFSVEQELFYDELRRDGRATGCGGYGTLFPFVWCVLLGGAGLLAGVDGADRLIEAGSLWILLGQVNLYRRVNELLVEAGEPPAVHAWWALLPPPLDVVVGLRQVHFLAKYWTARRGDAWERDRIAEDAFPFIAREPRFSLKEFARTPSMWFGVTKDWDDFDIDWLADPPEPPAGAAPSVTVLYDSKCGVCRWEVDNLGSLDASGRRVAFADIEDESYDPSAAGNGGVSYEAAMRSFTVVRDDGEVLEGTAAFAAAYEAVGLGWLFGFTRVPVVGPLAEAGYKVFARFRTDVTRGVGVDELIARRK